VCCFFSKLSRAFGPVEMEEQEEAKWQQLRQKRQKQQSIAQMEPEYTIICCNCSCTPHKPPILCCQRKQHFLCLQCIDRFKDTPDKLKPPHYYNVKRYQCPACPEGIDPQEFVRNLMTEKLYKERLSAAVMAMPGNCTFLHEVDLPDNLQQEKDQILHQECKKVPVACMGFECGWIGDQGDLHKHLRVSDCAIVRIVSMMNICNLTYNYLCSKPESKRSSRDSTVRGSFEK